MTIFSDDIKKCSICQEREPMKDREVCGHCLDRYDSHGEPYIIYSDIYLLRKGKTSLYIWAIEGRVRKIPKSYFDLFYGMDIDHAIDWLEDEDFEVIRESEAVWK